jgi:hypothetical protein
MFDYSVFDKHESKSFTCGDNVRKITLKNKSTVNKSNNRQNDDKIQVRIKICLYKQDYKMISIYKDESLEDLYIKMYNAIYPDYSTENNWDIIPPPGGVKRIPKLYYVSVFNKAENFIFVPVHKFISLSSFMKANPEYFNSISIMGPPTYNIYVLDEKSLEKINNKSKKTTKNYYQKFISCMN